MDLNDTLRHLYFEKERLTKAIALLEDLRGGPADGTKKLNRRGRKSMDPEERRSVSRRMKRYWERRRAAEARARD